eukprot:3430832-Lingulodinium_polyedra.AAC.1
MSTFSSVCPAALAARSPPVSSSSGRPSTSSTQCRGRRPQLWCTASGPATTACEVVVGPTT